MYISPLNLIKRAEAWFFKMVQTNILGSLLGSVTGGQLLGAGISLLGQRKAAKAQSAASAAAERQAELAYQRSLPWDVSGMFGTATFDEDGRELKMGLAEPWQKEYDIALGGAAKQREYIAGLEADPYTAGKRFYEQQKALYAPEQEKQRLDLEKRLLAQGMMGSTGGALQTQALREAQLAQDLEAQYAGLDKAQSLIDTYRARTASDLSQAEAIGQLPQKYAETGRGIGTGLSTIAGTAAGLASSAAQARGASEASRWLGMGQQFGNLVNPQPTPWQDYFSAKQQYGFGNTPSVTPTFSGASGMFSGI